MPEPKSRSRAAAKPAQRVSQATAQRVAQRPAQRPVPRPTQAQLIAESRQPGRLLLALVLLLVAFGGIIARDHHFWFGADDEAETSQPAAAHQEAAKVPQGPAAQASASQAPAMDAPVIKAQNTSAPAAKKSTSSARKAASSVQPKATESKAVDTKAADSNVVAANRTAVAPLDVEVVTGDTHRTVRPGSNATKVTILNSGSTLKSQNSAITAKVTTNAAELERVTTVQPALGSGDGTYPLLAQQMKVQGSVVLQAFIGSDGVIQNLKVLSGPSILASAAQQAVREWRFKPYMLNGQPVETRATITVNFTIKVADNSAAKSS